MRERFSPTPIDIEQAKKPLAEPRRPIPGGNRGQVLEVLLRFKQEHPLGGFKLKSIGEEIGLTRERVRQLYKDFKGEYDVPPLMHGMPKSKEYQTALDREVRRLRRRGLTVEQIAETLHVSVSTAKHFRTRVNESIRRARARFDRKVKALRQQRLGNKAIAEALGAKVSRVRNALQRVRKEDDTARLRSKKRSKEELAQFRAKVKELRDQGLTNKEIAQKIEGATLSQVVNSVSKLLAREEVARRRGGSIKKEAPSFDLAVLTFRQQGRTRKEMARLLGVDRSTVHWSLRRLAEARLIGLKKTGKKKS